MKKSKLTLSLVTGFVASLAMSGCKSLSKKDNSLLTYKGYDGTSYEICTDKMYAEYKKDENVISNFYDRILEVLVRDAFKGGYIETSKTYDTIVVEAESNVKAQKDAASKNAKSNSTSYKTEWKKILENNGVESAKELKEKFIYDLEKEVLEDDLYKELSKDGGLKTEWIEGALPYNVRHILAKVDSGKSDYTRGTITVDQAARISNIGKSLLLGTNTFGSVAEKLSEDGSASLWGDLGLVTNKVSSSGSFTMVAEFQLAIYIYDAIFNKANHTAAGDEEKISKLVSEEAKEAYTDTGLLKSFTKVPYGIFDLLALKSNGGLADVEKRPDNTVVGGENVQADQSVVYPRNIIWNKYLNHHEPFLITNTLVGSFKADGTEATVDTEDINYADKIDATIAEAADGKVGFRKAKDLKLSDDDELMILTDEKANPIFGVRSEFGIHFIVIQKSCFESTDTLSKYYQSSTPDKSEFDQTQKGISYVDYAGWDADTRTSRANAVKDAIKSYDGTYQYRLYQKLVAASKAESRFILNDAQGLNDAGKLLAAIDTYVDLQKEKNAYDQGEGFDLAWENYLDLIEQQQAERAKTKRVVPFGCAIGFTASDADYTDAVKELYRPGGACYYGNETK